MYWRNKAYLNCCDVVQYQVVLLAHLVPPPRCLDVDCCLLLAQGAEQVASQPRTHTRLQHTTQQTNRSAQHHAGR